MLFEENFSTIHPNPTCSKSVWEKRQALLRFVRNFFSEKNILEVETPLLSRAIGTDPHLDFFSTANPTRYLMTSPEFHLKRLLAAGFGDVYAITKAFRKDESGARHNPEFTIAEWYRLGMPMENLMEEVEALVGGVLGKKISAKKTRYAEAFVQYAHIDPYDESEKSWIHCCEENNIPPFESSVFCLDDWRDYIMAMVVEKKLSSEGEFIYDYPESQAALAKIEKGPDGKPCAKRFELYVGGLELCNGYQELTSAKEQRKRFEDDLKKRRALLKPLPSLDENFLAALEKGFPECSGVALGLDRLFMLALHLEDIREIILFPDEIA